ncbi:DUF421 domain-containing protein [Peribacillus sp. SCS-26]|uniref:DUF421 domain-containing protein n=1 Tax=Paraperibacillus marinus TaxID=3115295 RepID=UPI003905C4E5
MNHAMEIIIRTFSAFILLLLFVHILGKQVIAHRTLHLYIASITMGTIGGNMAFNLRIEFGYFILSLIVMGLIFYLLSKASRLPWAASLIKGRPAVLIENGHFKKDAMRETGCTLDTLEAMLREKNIFHLGEVEKAVFEINGTLSVLKKKKFLPLNRIDLEEIWPPRQYPVEIIIEGRWAVQGETSEEELKKVNEELTERGKSVHDIKYAAFGSSGRLYILEKE